MMGNNVAALAIETSSALGAVAVGRGPDILGVRRFSQPRAHAVEFLPSIHALCQDNGIASDEVKLVFVSAGPGSFTGLRIGITAARTLALANDARIVALPTLEVIAQNALDLPEPPLRVCVLLDAKRKRVYTASFAFGAPPMGTQGSLGKYVALDSPREADPGVYLASMPVHCAVLGEGVLYHQQVVLSSGLRVLATDLFPPRAETVYRLGYERSLQGDFVPARDLVPVYIRPPEAEEVWAARHG